MTTTNDQLAVLRRLRADGQISDEEFEDLAGGLSTLPDDPIEVDDATADAAELVEEPTGADESEQAPEDDDDEVQAGEGVGQAYPFLTPSLRTSLSVNYLGGLLIASLVLFVAGLVGVFSWWVSVPAILVLLTTVFEGWGKVTLIGGAVVAAIMLISFAFPANDTSQPDQTATVTLPPQDPYPPIPGSLGIYMDQVTELWNTVDGPPRINRGLTRHSEIGEYDTFIYRFGEWGRLAGAYDPDNDAIYALLITGAFSGDSTDQLFLHLCFVVAPYSQECIDSYYQQGLDGGTLEDFRDISREAEWTVGEGTWRLEIDQNVMTIRVYGPDAA